MGNINGFDHCLEGHSSQGSITGLFGRDSRFLSRAELQIEGKAPIPLGLHTNNGYAMDVTATNPFVEDKFNSDKIAVSRRVALRGALLEEITFQNFDHQSLAFDVTLSFAADFRDLFEVRQYANRQEWGTTQFLVTDLGFQFRYEGLCRSQMVSSIEFTHLYPHEVIHQTALWHLELAPHETIQLGYR
ncbi:MAG: amylo-alpha-1,6-glucosidase, partial [Acaryochloridaceae cyanobacterium RL_2_7]|nr:amylo-alpha-1,6-glucosidase [Acaryochloridaceae cyanobacterium RL_2_7]